MANGVDEPFTVLALYGRRLRALRHSWALTQEEVGRAIQTVGSRIAQLEGGTGSRPTLQNSRDLDGLFRTNGLFEDLWRLIHRESYPNWSKPALDAEAKAATIRTYASTTVPGLLQTPAYARALLSLDPMLTGEAQLEERLAGRLARQERLNTVDSPRYWVVLDEGVLRRPVGGTRVMHHQLADILRAAKRSRITVQILPFSEGGHPVMGSGLLNLLKPPNGRMVAYTEGADFGRFFDDKEAVQAYSSAYDLLQAHALSPGLSVNMIRNVMEDIYRDARVPTQSKRRRLAQVQLQQSSGRRLR